MIEFDITKQAKGWKWSFHPIRFSDGLHLSGEVGEWLHGHGHDCHTMVEYNEGDHWMEDPMYYLQFDDPNLAMLFKLTWL